MYNPGKPQVDSFTRHWPHNNEPMPEAPVFQGTGSVTHPVNKAHQPGNLAVQRSIMEIFDDFTNIISGELKSMNTAEFESARQSEK